MVFSTSWVGFGCNPANAVAGAEDLTLFIPSTVNLTLNGMAGIVTVQTLPVATRFVRILTADEAIRICLDAPPLLPGESTNTVVPASAFQVGDTVPPGIPYVLAIPTDSLTHALHLMAAHDTGGYAKVQLVALTE